MSEVHAFTAKPDPVVVTMERTSWAKLSKLMADLLRERVMYTDEDLVLLRALQPIYLALDRPTDAALAEVAYRSIEEDWAANSVPTD